MGILLTVVTLLVYYGRSTDYHYWQNTDKGGMLTLGTILPVNRIQILPFIRHRHLIDSCHSTGLLRAQY